MTSSVFLLVDNTDDSFTFTSSSDDWVIASDEVSPYAYAGGSTTRLVNQVDKDATGEFSLMFNGTAVEIIGDIPVSVEQKKVQVQVDDEKPQEVSLELFRSGIYRRWIYIKDLQPGPHSLHVTNIPPDMSVDFAVVKAGPNDRVEGKTVIIDDFGSDIYIDGAWGTFVSAIREGKEPIPLPYGFSSRMSLEESATASFTFLGTRTLIVVREGSRQLSYRPRIAFIC